MSKENLYMYFPGDYRHLDLKQCFFRFKFKTIRFAFQEIYVGYEIMKIVVGIRMKPFAISISTENAN